MSPAGRYLAFLGLALVDLSFQATNTSQCSPSPEVFVNATGSATLQDPFRTPTGPFVNGSGQWTWNIATESYADPTSNMSVRQALWLDITPPQSLSSPDLGYLGCALVVHGLKQSTIVKGQNDNGICGSMLSADCTSTMVKDTAQYAQLLSASTAVSAEEICLGFRTHNIWPAHGVPDNCAGDFQDHAWVEGFPFASPQLAAQPCATSQHNASLPLHTWGQSSYSPSNLAAYDNLTTSVTPLVSVLFVNHTTDFNTTVGYSESRLTCLRPSNVQAGSQQPTGVPSRASKISDVTWLGIVLMVMACAI